MAFGQECFEQKICGILKVNDEGNAAVFVNAVAQL